MGSSVIQRSRRAGVLCTLLWLLGIELLPAAHLAHHRADHTHAADGSIIPGAGHAHDARGRDIADYDHTGKLVLDHPSHAAGGIAHHALALHTAPPLPVLVAAIAVGTHLAAPPPAAPPSLAAARPTARGPPARSPSTSRA